ncbi:MAG: hypothetical protein SNJ67_05790 [Chloracidobacterium sp.]|uniref:Uncharacterized protein n=1 Tax=Chloracidobacterium validum TaxID=2821543 RepID=A0ABX8BBK4_9BACT|nr:hypothetical protein [Chloracidobacterium validum]QUW02915.1 hypothetical protein J8C06_00235 [Chloracidobacterium validum]
MKAVQSVASKASARSQSAPPSRKVVHPASESKAAAPARALASGAPKAEKKAKASPPTPSVPAVETPASEASSKKKSKKFLASAAPVSEATPPMSSARRNREREALNLYTTAMESFKQMDYDRARDVLLLLLNDFVLESEIADRARVFLKICEQKLHPAML